MKGKDDIFSMQMIISDKKESKQESEAKMKIEIFVEVETWLKMK